MSVVDWIVQKIVPRSEEEARAEALREAIHEEAKIGATVFGPIPNGVSREFFCLDENTWVWHEEWTDTSGKLQTMMTRYDIRPNGIFKAQNNNSYQPISRVETKNLLMAIHRYNQLVDEAIVPLLRA